MNTFIRSMTLATIIVAAVALVYVSLWTNQRSFASTISESSDYTATSTAASAIYGATIVGKSFKSGSGSFGSVIITGANTGVMNFYNATTSDVNLRTGNKATSTILLASIPASAAAGTYIFDVQYTNGLLLVLESGLMPTTTISYR